MATEFNYSFQVPFHQVDHAGIMFFAHLFTHAHDTYAALMETCSFGLPQIIEDGIYAIPLVHAEADYHRPMRHGDKISVSLKMERIGTTSFRLACQFSCNNKLCADTRTDHVFIALEAGKPARIPNPLRQALTKYSKEPG